MRVVFLANHTREPLSFAFVRFTKACATPSARSGRSFFTARATTPMPNDVEDDRRKRAKAQSGSNTNAVRSHASHARDVDVDGQGMDRSNVPKSAMNENARRPDGRQTQANGVKGNVRPNLSKPKGAVLASATSVDASEGNAPRATAAFANMGLTQKSARAISEVMKFTHATSVQDATLPHIMRGLDLLARAKTGSGKTVGFLLPAIERLAKMGAPKRGNVSCLVVSPTRELAQQIAEEAKSLLTFHEFGVQVVFGGTNMNSEKKRMQSSPIEFLIATPGRLIDHLETGDLASRVRNLDVLVLDEADQLLDMGFRPSIERILSYLPTDRQTLLFSATVPKTVHEIAANALRPGHQYIDCVGDDAPATNVLTDQSMVMAPFKDHLTLLTQAIEAHQAEEPNHKVMVFFPTARATQLAAEMFEALGKPVFEIHSRKSQSARTKAADQFRASKSAVMMSSDVTARGMDFPDVTFVMQIGVPSTREQYIHRLGRTGRAGKNGQGLLMLDPAEKFFCRLVQDLPITVLNPTVDQRTDQRVRVAVSRISDDTKEQTYAAWLGFYNGSHAKMGWSKEQLIAVANDYALTTLQCRKLPGLLAKTVGKMGLRDYRSLLNIVSELQSKGGDGNRGGSGGGGGGGEDKDEGLKTEALQLSAGTFLLMPAGVRHSAWVTGGAPVDLWMGEQEG